MDISDLPISADLHAFMEEYPGFEEAFKVKNPDAFEVCPTLILSYPEHPPHNKDQVIGFFYLDKENHAKGKDRDPVNEPLFKQDYVSNLGFRKDKLKKPEFRIYTARDFVDGVKVHPMKAFFGLYANGDEFYHYVRSIDGKRVPMHWYPDIEDLRRSAHPQICEWGRKVKARVEAR